MWIFEIKSESGSSSFEVLREKALLVYNFRELSCFSLWDILNGAQEKGWCENDPK